jgi:hypothetical protein
MQNISRAGLPHFHEVKSHSFLDMGTAQASCRISNESANYRHCGVHDVGRQEPFHVNSLLFALNLATDAAVRSIDFSRFILNAGGLHHSI